MRCEVTLERRHMRSLPQSIFLLDIYWMSIWVLSTSLRESQIGHIIYYDYLLPHFVTYFLAYPLG